jgi:SlyX protein
MAGALTAELHAPPSRNTGMSEQRLVQLEILAAEQEKIISDLSGEVAEQWKVIDRLQKRLDALTKRFLELEEQSAPDVPITRPPHY